MDKATIRLEMKAVDILIKKVTLLKNIRLVMQLICIAVISMCSYMLYNNWNVNTMLDGTKSLCYGSIAIAITVLVMGTMVLNKEISIYMHRIKKVCARSAIITALKDYNKIHR